MSYSSPVSIEGDSKRKEYRQRMALERLLDKLGVPDSWINRFLIMSGREDIRKLFHDSGSLLEEIAATVKFAVVDPRIQTLFSAINLGSKFVRLGLQISQLIASSEEALPSANTILKREFLGDDDDNSNIQNFHLGNLQPLHRRLFRRYLGFVANVHEVHRLGTTYQTSTSDLEEWAKSLEVSRYMIPLEFNGVRIILQDDCTKFLMWCERRHFDMASSLEAAVSAKILDELKHMMLVVRDTDKHYYYEDTLPALSFEEIPDVELYDEDIYNFLQPAVKRCLEFGLKTGILIYGPPGLSKTSTALKIMKEFDAIRVRLPNSGYTKVKQLLGYTGSKRIVLIDDADIADNEDKNETNSELLNFLDSSTYDICIMIMNEVNVLPAIVRPGRMDLKKLCTAPDTKLRSKIITNLMSKYSWGAEGHDVLVDCTDGMTHAEIHNVFKTALRYNTSLQEALKICVNMESTLKAHIVDNHE